MERISFLLRVKEGQQQEYIRRHEQVWPEVLEEHRRAGIKKMSIFMRGRELFLYMEVDDYARAVKILGDSPVAVRWEEYMAPIMEPGEDDEGAYDPRNAFPGSLPEVFFWESARSEDVPAPPATNGHANQPAQIAS